MNKFYTSIIRVSLIFIFLLDGLKFLLVYRGDIPYFFRFDGPLVSWVQYLISGRGAQLCWSVLCLAAASLISMRGGLPKLAQVGCCAGIYIQGVFIYYQTERLIEAVRIHLLNAMIFNMQGIIISVLIIGACIWLYANTSVTPTDSKSTFYRYISMMKRYDMKHKTF